MNDDFLRKLQRPPSAAFERQLRARLREQEHTETATRRPSWPLLLIAILVGGTALAAVTYLTMQPAPAPVVQVTSVEITASSAPSASLPPPTNITQAAEPQEKPEAAPASGAYPVSNLESSTPPLIRIAVTPDIQALAKLTAPYTVPMRSGSFEPNDGAAAMRELCIGSAEQPAMVITSRRITKDELDVCNAPAVGGVFEATLAHVAIVVTGAQTGIPIRLSRDAVMRAVLKRVPSPDDPSRLIDNPYTHWNQIDNSLEERRIEIYGPARDSSEFEVFAATLLETACNKYPSIRALQHTDRKAYESICFALREDGVYTQTRLDSMFVRQRLWANPNAIAIVDYLFYAANSPDLLGSLLAGVPATRESILNGSYGAARTLYFYIPRWRYERIPSVRGFVDGYLRMQDFGSRGVRIPPDGDTDSRRFHRPLPLTEVKLN
jgi:phosphate transport system substrate-binding protein